MKKNSKAVSQQPAETIGIDLGDKVSPSTLSSGRAAWRLTFLRSNLVAATSLPRRNISSRCSGLLLAQ